MKPLLILLLACVLLISGCCCCCPGCGSGGDWNTFSASEECTTSFDCNYGEVCDDGKCVKETRPF
ncbi:MAG: hypothetical protein FJY77_03100 [Candidatus Altiarchaeales archaeon]|nr:hypothetical protein [Candidatus Altiarchaeales archaeon]